MTEGWALYAERLMDELGYLGDPGTRLGYLEAQLRRAIRVIVDIGMHLQMELPADVLPEAENGRTWTPELAVEFFAAHAARSTEFVAGEIIAASDGPARPSATRWASAPGWPGARRPAQPTATRLT